MFDLARIVYNQWEKDVEDGKTNLTFEEYYEYYVEEQKGVQFMMRVQVTKGDVMKQNRFVICVGYCDLQHLLHFKDSQFYTAGMYGWNADIYQVSQSAVIVTGYRPFGDIKPDRAVIREYDARAARILHDSTLSYFEKESNLDFLINEFLKAVLNLEE